MIAMGDNVKQNQMLLDILERCVIQLGILVAQGPFDDAGICSDAIGYFAGYRKLACKAAGTQTVS